MTGKLYHAKIIENVKESPNPTWEDAKILHIINKLVDSHVIVRECIGDYSYTPHHYLDPLLTDAITKKGNTLRNLTQWGEKCLEEGTLIITLNNIGNRINFWFNSSDILLETAKRYRNLFEAHEKKKIISHAENELLKFTLLLEEISINYANNMKKIEDKNGLSMTKKIGYDFCNMLLFRESELLRIISEINCLSNH